MLVTMDKDFGDLVFLHGAAHAGIIRLPDVFADRRIALVAQVLADVSEADMKHAIVVISGSRIRIARHPPEA